MHNNSNTQHEIVDKSAKKDQRRANKLLRFFANWSEELSEFGIDDIIESFNIMYTAFIESHFADDLDRRSETQYVFNRVNDLLMQVKKAKESTSCLPGKIENLISIEKTVKDV